MSEEHEPTAQPDIVTFDRELIAAIVQGDPIAAEQLVERYARLIYNILIRDLRLSQDHAEEVFQSVFVHLWEDNYRRLRQWRGRGKFASYLTVLVCRLACDYFRDRQTRPTSGNDPANKVLKVSDPPGFDLVKVFIVHERRKAIFETLQHLSPRDHELIERKHYREQSYKEIAEAMDLTINHVGVALLRAEKSLQKTLQKRYPALFGKEPEEIWGV